MCSVSLICLAYFSEPIIEFFFKIDPFLDFCLILLLVVQLKFSILITLYQCIWVPCSFSIYCHKYCAHFTLMGRSLKTEMHFVIYSILLLYLIIIWYLENSRESYGHQYSLIIRSLTISLLFVNFTRLSEFLKLLNKTSYLLNFVGWLLTVVFPQYSMVQKTELNFFSIFYFQYSS